MKGRFIGGFILLTLLFTTLTGCSDPATFSLSSLKIGPEEVISGEAVAVSVFVANTGGKEGTYKAKLTINGEEEESKSVTLAAGESKGVAFLVTKEDVGNYNVAIGDLSGSFVVVAPASFSLSNLNIIPTKLTTSDKVFISVTVTNTGGSEGAYNLVCNVDNGFDWELTSLDLAPGESVEYIFSLPAGDAGEHEIAIEDISGSFTVVEPIRISNLNIGPGEVLASEPVDISVSLYNPNESEESCDLSLEINGAEAATRSITLAAGESKDITFTVVRDSVGTYDIAIGDLSGSFIVVAPAVLSISKFDVEPSIVWPNEEVIISVLVANKSNVAGSDDVIIYIDGEVEQSANITLAAGESGQVDFSVFREDVGTHGIAIEKLTDDNFYAATFFVATPLSMKLEVDASTWGSREEPYDIYSKIKGKLESSGIRIVGEGDSYDGLLSVVYTESRGDRYTSGDYGTDIRCNSKLYNSDNDLLEEHTIFASTPDVVTGTTSLYSAALSDFLDDLYYRSFGHIMTAKLGSESTFLRLISYLEWDSYKTREMATYALGEIGDTRAIEPLIDVLLEDTNSFVRRLAASALGKIGDERAIEALTSAKLNDEDEDVRYWADWALKQIQDG